MRRSALEGRAIVWSLAVVVVVALTVPFAPAAGAQEPPPDEPAAAGLSPSGGKGVLSSALAELAGAPTIASRSDAGESASAVEVEAQLAALDLPVGVAGSMMVREGGRILVDISVASVDDATIGAVEALGGVIVTPSAQYRRITAEVAPTALHALAEVPGVLAVNEVPTPLTSSNASARQAEPEAPPVSTNAVNCATNPTGIKSEGDTQLAAATARSASSVDGTGVKVGVLSDTYSRTTFPTSASTDVTNAELPGATNPCGNTTAVQVLDPGPTSGGIDEGRAMLQIVHDLAPKAPLAFSSAFNGELDFANEIRALQSAGSKVIVDDVSYFTEPFYQDGPIAAAVNDVTASGVTYFSSAGNSTPYNGSPSDGGSYEAMAFRQTACPNTFPATYVCHDYNAGAGVDNGNQMTIPGGGTIFRTSLGWNQPMYGVSTDLDLVLIDAGTGTVLASSLDDNAATGRPVEFLAWQNNGGTRNVALVVARYNPAGTGTPRFKTIVHRNPATSVEWRGGTVTGTDTGGPTVFGHNANLKSASVAAIPYNNANTVEPFSSRGPATYCWQPVNGTSPSPAMSCTTKNLDIAATDGTSNSFFGGSSPPYRFYGTSAAAPHAAAIAALQVQKQPCRTPAQYLAAQRASGVAFGGFGIADYGSGRVTATTAITNLAACNPPVAAGFHPLTPSRILDSRTTNGGWNAKLVAGQPRELQVTGRSPSNIPANASAVVMNVTVTSSNSGSFLKVWPSGTQSPNVSNLNFSPGQTIPNLVTVRLGTGGKVEISTAVGSVDVIADVVGYFDNGSGPGDTFVGIDPVRLLDSRGSNGGWNGPLPAGSANARTLTVRQPNRPNGVPSDATAVIANVTVTGSSAESFLRAWPTGDAEPNVSNLNFGAGQTIPNLVMLKIGTGGNISFTTAAGSTHVVVDVVGYFVPTGGAKFYAIDPTRILDSRFNNGLSGMWSPNQSRTLQVSGGVVPAGASGIIANFTVTDGTLESLLTVYPNGTNLPTASNLNFGAGQVIPNLVAVRLPTAGAGNGKVSIYNNQGNVNVVADVVGYFKMP